MYVRFCFLFQTLFYHIFRLLSTISEVGFSIFLPRLGYSGAGNTKTRLDVTRLRLCRWHDEKPPRSDILRCENKRRMGHEICLS